MRARRALAIAISTPILLAAVGMSGASAATRPGPTADRTAPTADLPAPAADSEHSRPSRHAQAQKAAEDAMEPDEGLITGLAGELLGRVGPADS
ncbi:hypothetical protein SRB17_62230 [Streptomyces sp. RB17]|nr:hypothetical protein [Streptomyces sp. RB17]